jgi:Tfp pilus assembly protein PilZ
MQNMRRHKRFRLDLIEVNGQISLADKVEILDISLGGIALKVDRRLNIGREYLLKLREKGKALEVKCIVVRAELSGIEQRANGESVSIYTAGLTFKEGSTARIADFIKPIEQHKQMKEPDTADRRLDVRFNIGGPLDILLSYPAQFTVKTISLGGMLIRTEQALALESKVPMTLSLNADNPVTFIGRVALCQKSDDQEDKRYDIGVEFTDLTDQNKILLKSFIDLLAQTDAKNL